MAKRVIDQSIPFIKENQITATWGTDGNDSNHYLMWSGGTDSTLMLYELLDAYGADRVCAISYRYPWLLENKRNHEEIAREAIKAHLATFGPKFTGFKHTEIVVDQVTKSGGLLQTQQLGGLPQALAWMLSVPMYADQSSYIYDGGIKCDDLTLRLESYHQLFRGIAGVMRKDLTLREPYLYYTKANVLAKLIEYGLYDITWFCEMPGNDNKPCYHCTPCSTHIAALVELSIADWPSELVKKKALHELNRIREIKEGKNNTESTDISLTRKAEDKIDKIN
ncbi:MAG: 7-cyano-7-deazaguanine synthase [Lachnospiraceae bacterium]|nr:7-cyano-7-deazaguanine synthase [Lachnospiraceae bacterium]